jgi:pimeloyl-ACP methyl ester carboxylesterase
MLQSRPTLLRAALVTLAILLPARGGTVLREQQAPPPLGHLERAPHVVRTFDGREYDAELGHLTVAETRRGGSANTVDLAFLRLPTRAAKPGPPTVFLMGGPGIPGSVMARVPPYATLFDRLRESGDVVILDQRGIGMSSPALSCPSVASLPAAVFASRRSIIRELRQRTTTCAAQWTARDIAITQYNTAASADDVEDVRRALGVERLNLLAFSYGTHVALAALRRHPSSFSNVVLAGTRGPDHSLKLPSTFDFVFRRLSTLARAGDIAGRQLPTLVEVLQRQLERLERAPIVVTVTDRREKRQIPLTIGKEALQILLTNAIDDARLPALLYAMSLGDDTLLAGVLEGVYNGLGDTNLMGRLVDCASGASAERLAQVRREAGWALLGNPSDNLVRSPEFCEAFAHIDLGDDFRRAIWSDVRTLFVSGTLDAKAPVFEAEEIRRGFPNSAHLLVDNGLHETLPIPEVQQLVVDFVAGRDVPTQRLVVKPPEFPSIEQAKARPSQGR